MPGPFQPDWESLGAHRVSERFRDAKFGIFIHWGLYSVPPSGNDWYSRNMYMGGTSAFKDEMATYPAFPTGIQQKRERSATSPKTKPPEAAYVLRVHAAPSAWGG